MACQPICGKGPLRQIEIEIEAEVEIEIISLRRFHQFPIANPTPLGWQANGVRRDPQATENTVRRFPPGAPSLGRGLFLCQFRGFGV